MDGVEFPWLKKMDLSAEKIYTLQTIEEAAHF